MSSQDTSDHKRIVKRYLAQERVGVVRDMRGVVTHETWRCHVEYVDGATELTHERRPAPPRLDHSAAHERSAARESVSAPPFGGWGKRRGSGRKR